MQWNYKGKYLSIMRENIEPSAFKYGESPSIDEKDMQQFFLSMFPKEVLK